MKWDLTLTLFIKQTFFCELRLELEKSLIQTTHASASQSLNGELNIPSRYIHTQTRTHFNQVAGLRHKANLTIAAAEHHTADLAFFIFQREIPMPAVICLEVRNLPANPNGVEAGLQRGSNGAV